MNLPAFSLFPRARVPPFFLFFFDQVFLFIVGEGSQGLPLDPRKSFVTNVRVCVCSLVSMLVEPFV